MSDENAVAEEKVGYGNPPKHTQFQPGQSGNPGGRPKQHDSLFAALIDVLEGDVALPSDGEQILLQGYEAVARALVKRAVEGDGRAAQILLREVK
jgi:hypothetical protein